MSGKTSKPGSTLRYVGTMFFVMGFVLLIAWFFSGSAIGLPTLQIILILLGGAMILFGYLKQIAEK